MVLTDFLEHQGLLDQLVLRDHQEPRELLDRTEFQDWQDQTVLQVLKEIQGLLETQALRDLRVPPDQLDQLEMSERPELMDKTEPRDSLVAPDRLDLKEHLDHKEALGLPDLQVLRAQQVQTGRLVLKARPVRVEIPGHPVLLAHRAQQVHLDSQVLKVHREMQDHKAPTDRSDPAEHPAQTDPMDLQVNRARPVFPDHRDFPEWLGSRDSREERVSLEEQDHLVHLDQPVKVALLVWLETMVLQEQPEHPDLVDCPELRGCLEVLVRLDLRDL